MPGRSRAVSPVGPSTGLLFMAVVKKMRQEIRENKIDFISLLIW
jgi:hypothetical protein